MKIQILKFHLDREENLSSLAKLTNLEILYLNLGFIDLFLDIKTTIKTIELPIFLKQIFINAIVSTNTSINKITKTLHILKMLKVPHDCKLYINLKSDQYEYSLTSDDILTCCDRGGNYYKASFLKAIDKYCDNDNYFIVKNQLSFSQLLKIQELTEDN